MVSGSYLDLTPFNLIETRSGELQHFDQEWVAEDAVPLTDILFRGLYFCFSRPLYFMAPSAGTPLNAFDLVSKTIAVFRAGDENDVVDEFRRLEQKYFGPVSPDADYIPVNFQLNLFPEKAESDDQLSILPIPILDELNINCYYAANENDYPDSDSIASHVSLEAGKNIYTFRITTPANISHENERFVINKVKICFSDKPGLINFYSLQVKRITRAVC